MKQLFLGTSGYNYREWRQTFYPPKLKQKDWLSYYASLYNSVEINNSFYSSVKAETYTKWYEQTPEDFRFVIKGHRYITQLKKLHDIDESTADFFQHVFALQEKLSCVLWQFPISFRCNSSAHYDLLIHFLSLLPSQVRHAFEFRDESWFKQPIYDVLSQYNAALVISQSSQFPEVEIITAEFVYMRFHGPSQLYSSGYSDDELTMWAEKVVRHLKTHDVYCYFNNDAGGHAVKNVEVLKKKLLGNGVRF